jgi:hypothetical protein
MTSDTFKQTRNVVATKRKRSKSHGKGNKKNHADPFTDEDIATLKQNWLFGNGK